MTTSGTAASSPALPATSDRPAEARPVWMVGPLFDTGLLAGAVWLPLVLAVATLGLEPPTWAWLLLALLVFDPHLSTTYLRLYGDPVERKTHFRLGFLLPLAIGAGLAGAAFVVPLGALGFALYHWQFWHTVRQTYGVLRVYQARRGTVGSRFARLEVAALWAVPLLGLLAQWRVEAGDYLGLPKPAIPVPGFVLAAAAAAALSVLGAYVLATLVRRARGVPLPTAELSMILVSAAVFVVGPFVLADLFWDNLLLSLYHSTQYVAFAALFQKKKSEGPGFAGGVLAWVASPWSWAKYVFVLVALGAAYSAVVRWALPGLVGSALAVALVEWTLRVHHYMVDARIWKLRRAPGVAQVLGVK